jgi:hypothetical protein
MRRKLVLFSALAVICCVIVSQTVNYSNLVEDLSANDPDVEHIRASKNRAEITRAAHAARQTLKGIDDALTSSDSSLQKTELRRQVRDALSAVQDLEKSSSDDELDSDQGDDDSAADGELSESKAESLMAADAKRILDSANGISLNDDSAVRAELRKLAATARRLRTEMSSFSNKKGAAWSDAEAVEQAAHEVEEEGQHAMVHDGSRARSQVPFLAPSHLLARVHTHHSF